MKRILRSGLGATLAGVLLLSVLFGGVAWAGLDDETTEIPTVSEKESAKDPVKVDPVEDETHVISIAPGVSSIRVLYEWTASTLVNDQKIFSSNLLDDSDERQRWNESASMYTQQETKQVMLHSFLNEQQVDGAGVAYGLSEKMTTTEYDLKTEKVGVERKEDRYGRTAVDNLAVDFYVSEELKGMQAVGLSFVYAYKPDGNELNPANSGLLRVYVSKDGKTWSEDYVSVQSAHILGSGTTERGESVIYYQVYSENLLDIEELSSNDKIMMLRIMPDGEAGIAAGDFSINSLTLTGYGVMSDFVKAVPSESVVKPITDDCRAMVVNAVRSSEKTDALGRILDGISLVTRVAPEDIPAMLDTVGLRLMDGISIHAAQSVMQLLQWVKDLRADDLDQILSDHEEITTTQKLLQDLNTPQQVFKAYAACKPGDLLVQITENDAKAYMVVKSEPIWNDGGDVVVYDDKMFETMQKNDSSLTKSQLTYLDANGVEQTKTFFNLYMNCFAPMVVDVLADDAVQPVRVDGHVSIADGVKVAVSSNFDIEKIDLSMEGFVDTVTNPGMAEIYTSEELDTLVAELAPGKYEMTATVYSRCYNETPVTVPLKFEIRNNTVVPVGITASFQGLVHMNLYLELSRFASEVDPEDVGLLVWSMDPGSVEQAKTKLTKAVKVPGARKADDGRYVVHTDGIAAPQLGDTKYMLAYVDTGNGTYAYANKIVAYSPAQYAMELVNNEEFQNVAISMLNYGAAAQEYFDYNTDKLMNAGLTEEQKELNWDGSLLDTEDSDSPAKTTYFTRSEIATKRSASLSLDDGAINLNFYVTFDTNQTVTEKGIYYWNADAYNNAEVLTADNATAQVGMVKLAENQYRSSYRGIPAAEMEKAVYACAYVKTEDGTTHYSGVMAMSPEVYAKTLIEDTTSKPALVTWMKWMVVYGEYAKNYWSN